MFIFLRSQYANAVQFRLLFFLVIYEGRRRFFLTGGTVLSLRRKAGL